MQGRSKAVARGEVVAKGESCHGTQKNALNKIIAKLKCITATTNYFNQLLLNYKLEHKFTTEP